MMYATRSFWSSVTCVMSMGMILRPADGRAQGVVETTPATTTRSETLPVRSEAAGDIDSSMGPARQDWTRYTWPGACLQAARTVEHLILRTPIGAQLDQAHRTPVDTVPFIPKYDSVPTAVVNIARSCGQRLHADNVPVSELLDLMQVALLAGDDARAHTAAERYIAAAGERDDRIAAIFAVDTLYLSAKPARLTAAAEVGAHLDALGAVASKERIFIHQALLRYASSSFDIAQMERQSVALAQSGLEGQGEGIITLLIAELYQSSSPSEAVDRTMARIKNVQFAPDAKPRELLTGFAAIFGQPIPPFPATAWRGRDSAAHTWPVPGKVSLMLAPGPNGFDNAQVAAWRRLVRKYGSALNFTIRVNTQGYFGDSPPLTFAQEAARLERYVHDELQLPVTLAIQEQVFDTLPDGRRMPKESPPVAQAHTFGNVIADPEGKLAMFNFDQTVSGEALLDAWIAKLVKR